jgi:hypothetical protein
MSDKKKTITEGEFKMLAHTFWCEGYLAGCATRYSVEEEQRWSKRFDTQIVKPMWGSIKEESDG